MLKQGFLNDKERPTLYGPEGSGEVSLSDAQKRKMDENEFQHKANEKMHDMMNRGGGGEVAPWYNPNFPKGCQYNSPGCSLSDFETSSHSSELHRSLLSKSSRWQELISSSSTNGLDEIRLPYAGVKDTDLDEIFTAIKYYHNESLKILDLSMNDICDAGAQLIASRLCVLHTAPNLSELKLFGNKIGELGKTSLFQGLKVLRKNLSISIETPDFLKN